MKANLTGKHAFERSSKAPLLDVLAIGNANIDLMINDNKIPNNAEFTILPGGSACNFSVGCAKLGLKAGFAGFLGNGYFSRIILKALRKEGVKCFVKQVSDAPTGFVVVFTKKYFKKYIKHAGANEYLKTLNIKQFFNKARHVHLATPPLELLKQLIPGLSVSVDPGASLAKYSLDELRPYLSRVTVFTPNEEEAREITGHNYLRAANELFNAGIKIVVIKRSKKGVYVKTRNESFYLKSINYEAVDTTGAGDAFDSAFITALLKGLSLSEACKWGIISSNVCVTKLGAQQSVTLKELKELYNKYYSNK